MNREVINISDFIHIKGDPDKLLFLLKFASIAPSSHNTQPWKFKLVDNNIIEILPDFSRKLTYSDPHNRQLFLSLGTCLSNLILASKAYGLSFTVEKENQEGASVKYDNLESTSIDEKSLQAIIDRGCNREPFESKPIPTHFVEMMKQIAKGVEVSIVDGPEIKQQITNEVGSSIQDAFLDKQFTKELSTWIKPSLKSYQTGMPGYYIGVPWLASFVLPWIIAHGKIDKMQRKMDEGPLKAAPMFVLLSNVQDNPIGWIEVGKVFEEIAVEATKIGLKIGLQGAPIEIGNHFEQIKHLFGAVGRPMIFFRIGFASKSRPKSPRLKVSQLISQ